MKLGLDIHGVLDTNPYLFINMAGMVKASGGIVYIITGSSLDEDLTALLLKLNGGIKFWDHLISVQDGLMRDVKPIGYNKYKRPVWDDGTWDRFKGDFCFENKIDLHIDDTIRYKKYFKTPFLHYEK